MLGHLKPSFCKSSVESKENYWEFYCSVCASLRKQYNTAYSLLLNNEITLILSAFQDEFADARPIKTACPASGFLVKNFALAHEAVDMAAHFSVLLAWIKALDWHTDKPNIFKKALLARLQKRAQKIIPLLQPDSQQIITEYARITEENEQNFRLVRYHSNQLAQMLVKEIGLKLDADIETIESLQTLFGRAGELIAIADHLIDLDKDQQHNQYNPIVKLSEEKGTPLAQEYVALKTEYYILRQKAMMSLPAQSPAFAEAFKRSVHHLDKQIEKNLPACMCTEEGKQWVGKMETVKTSFSHIPQMAPQAGDCCDEACIGACLGVCCQACAQGCCDEMCNICSNSKCCENSCDNCCGGSGANRAEREARRQKRREAREARRKEREERRKNKQENNKNKENKNKDADDTY